MRPDPEKVAALIAEIAQEEIGRRYGTLAKEAIRKKGVKDVVTDVDHACERALERALKSVRPDACFIGEERAEENPGSAAELLKAKACWIVDPLDGTRNFVNHVDEFGTIVAFVEGGATTMGWIYGVPHDRMAVAVRGDGASCDGDRIVVQPAGARLVGLRSLGWLEPERQDRLRARLKAHFDSRLSNCSAYAYLDLARGLVDFKLSSRIHPWDHAAGSLLVEELGGRAAWFDSGEAYAPVPTVDRPLLVTAAGRDWEGVAAKLRD